MITKSRIRKILARAGISILDARVAWWRSSQSGFTIRQETDTPQKYINIESRYPAGQGDTEITNVQNALQNAGIRSGCSLGIIYVHPLQLEGKLMAALSLAKPGTEHGPCAEPCQHTDCAQTRAMAAALCALCSKPIGYDKRFYLTSDKAAGDNYAHAVCYEAARVELGRRQG